MRILITGGAGRLGITVCRTFLRGGFDVRVLDLDNERNRRSIRELNGEAEVCWGDITDRDSVRGALAGVDAVVHMAGILPPLASDNPELARRVNVEGTRMITGLIREGGCPIPFVFTSSVAVFGPTPDAAEPVCPEKVGPCPVDTYGLTKLEAENVIRESGIDYLILRLTAVMYFTFEISDLKRMFSVPLDNRIEFCHPDDLAQAIFNAVRRFSTLKGNTLIVSGGPGQRMLYRDMVNSILEVMGLPMPPARKFSRQPFYLDWYDTSRSQRMLDFQRKTFTDYIRDYSNGLTRRYSTLFLPFMRYFVSPLFGWVVVKFM